MKCDDERRVKIGSIGSLDERILMSKVSLMLEIRQRMETNHHCGGESEIGIDLKRPYFRSIQAEKIGSKVTIQRKLQHTML